MSGFALEGLYHIAIRTFDLDATVAFYKDILGMQDAERPPFGYPGSWLATPSGAIIVHLYGGKQGLAEDGTRLYGTGAIDHVSLFCSGFHDITARLDASGITWKEFDVPNTPLWQVFVYDPSGVLLELTFDENADAIKPREIPRERMYIAGASFFDR